MNRTGTRCKSLEHRLFCTEDTDANCSPLCMRCGPMKQARSCERKEAYDHSGHRSWFARGGNWSAADRADWFLNGAGDLTRALGVSALVIGVLLAGLEPEEMLTAAIASARGAPALAVGNVIGTNVTIVTAALGISALIFPLVIDKRVRRQALIATLVFVLPIVLLFLGIVAQLAGVLLLVVFVVYTLFLFRTDQEAIKHIHATEQDSEKAWHSRPRLHWKPVLLTFGGLAAMAGGGPAIVEGALRLTQTIGISQGAVGVTPTTILWYSNYQALATRDIGVVPRHRSP